MKIVLINDEGQSIASFDVSRTGDRSPVQAFELLDLLEKLLERATLDSGVADPESALPAAGVP